MSFHPEQYIPHIQHHVNDVRREAGADAVIRAQRRARAATRRARRLYRASRLLAACAGWLGRAASGLHARAQMQRAADPILRDREHVAVAQRR